MEAKECRKCKITKPLSDYQFRKDTNQHRNLCRQCRSEYSLNYYYKQHQIKNPTTKNNKEICLELGNMCCVKCNRIKPLTEFHRAKDFYRSNCKDCGRDRQREYSKNNRDKVNATARRNKARRKEDPNYKQKYNKRQREYHKERIAKDPLYAATHKIRNLIATSLKRRNFTKQSLTYEILGCKYNEFKEYIEKQFQPGMSWENHGWDTWHLDHIIPISSAKTKEELIKLNHYSNFQPLWAKDNIEKRDKLFF